MPDQAESEEAEERSSPSAHVVYETIRQEGEDELQRNSSALAWSALAAGLSMGFSFLAEALLRRHLPEARWQGLITKLGYSVGFVIVILGRQQLFTENTLTVVLPLLLQKKLSVLLNVLRLWSIVLAANLAGGFLFAWAAAGSGAFDPELRGFFAQTASEAMSAGFGTIFLRAIYAGWLIALMVWLLPFAETARVWVISLLTYLVGLGHFPHIIAGAIEVFYLLITGAKSMGEVFGGYLAPALLGNIVGGVSLVAALAHGQIVGEKGGSEGKKGSESIDG